MQTEHTYKRLNPICLVLLGLIVFLGTVISQLPLSLAEPYLKKVPNLQYQNASGTLWNGRLSNATVIVLKGKKIDLGQVGWQLKPLDLFTGNVTVDFETQHQQRRSQGQASISISQTVTLKHTNFQTDVAWFQSLVPEAGFLNGNIGGDIETLEWDDKQLPPQITGKLFWQGGVVVPKIEEGYYQISLTNDDQAIKGTVSSKDAPFDVSGNVTLNEQWQYSTQVTLKPNTKTNMTLFDAISRKAKQNADGSVTFEQSGTPLYRAKK